jgi:hypothetical protein
MMKLFSLMTPFCASFSVVHFIPASQLLTEKVLLVLYGFGVGRVSRFYAAYLTSCLHVLTFGFSKLLKHWKHFTADSRLMS